MDYKNYPPDARIINAPSSVSLRIFAPEQRSWLEVLPLAMPQGTHMRVDWPDGSCLIVEAQHQGPGQSPER